MESPHNKTLIDFGKRLREVRHNQSISQEHLAELAELDRTYISLLERGLRNPTLDCIAKLARSLNTSVSHLCSFDREDAQ